MHGGLDRQAGAEGGAGTQRSRHRLGGGAAENAPNGNGGGQRTVAHRAESPS